MSRYIGVIEIDGLYKAAQCCLVAGVLGRSGGAFTPQPRTDGLFIRAVYVMRSMVTWVAHIQLGTMRPVVPKEHSAPAIIGVLE